MIKNNTLSNVSIALCTYNGAKFIEKQINSILEQSYAKIVEIICVDDCSLDDTVSILHKIKRDNPKLIIVENSSNLGYIHNFEKALTLCSSPFIAISDQDDIWYPTKVEKLMKRIGDKLMVYSDTEYIDENEHKVGRKMSDFRQLGECQSCLNFALFNGVSGHTMIIRKELLSLALPFNDVVPHDYWLAFHAAKTGSIAYVNEPLVGYRQHSSNVLGAIGVGVKKKYDPYIFFYDRLITFSAALDEKNKREKQVIDELAITFIDTSLTQRWNKVKLFLKNNDELLFFKRRSGLRKYLYCVKIFFKAI